MIKSTNGKDTIEILDRGTKDRNAMCIMNSQTILTMTRSALFNYVCNNRFIAESEAVKDDLEIWWEAESHRVYQEYEEEKNIKGGE